MKKLVLQFILKLKNKKIGANEVLAFSTKLFNMIKDYLLKKSMVKLISFLPAYLTGPVGWFGRMAITLLITKTLRPIFNKTILKIYSAYKKKKFKKEGENLEQSENETSFDDNFDNLS